MDGEAVVEKRTLKMKVKQVGKWLSILLVTVVIIILPFLIYIYLLPSELHIIDNLLTFIGLLIAYYTLWATLFIAIFIYWLQKRNSEKEEEQRIEQAKAAMLLEIENAFEMYLFIPENDRDDQYCNGIKDVLSSNAGELRKILSAEEFHHLVEIVNTIHKGDVNGAKRYLRSWLQILYLSEYQKYFVSALHYTDLLNRRTFELISKLRGNNEKYQKMDKILGNEGQILFENRGDYIRVISDGKIYLDGKIGFNDIYDEPVILDGFGKNDIYEGHYIDGFYEGEGIQYDEDGKKLREGKWSQNKLVSGKEYNWLIKVTNGVLSRKTDSPDDSYEASTRFSYEKYELYGERNTTPFSMSINDILEEGIDSFCVVDILVTEDTEKVTNIRPLDRFLKKRNPELIEILTKA